MTDSSTEICGSQIGSRRSSSAGRGIRAWQGSRPVWTASRSRIAWQVLCTRKKN